MSNVTTDQPTAAPTSKVAAATVGATAATLLAFLLGEFDVELTAEASAALATLLAFVFGYFKRERVDGLTVHRAGDRGYGIVEIFAALLLALLCVIVLLALLDRV